MQDQRQRGSKVYFLHAPEVESIGKRKAHRPSEFGVKVSVATTRSSLERRPVRDHIAALPGNPYDGHTLATVIPAMEDMIGNTVDPYSPMPVIAATMRQLTTSSGSIRQARSAGSHCRSNASCGRAAIEPVIGHPKAEHRMGRNNLAHHAGDAVNAVLAAAG